MISYYISIKIISYVDLVISIGAAWLIGDKRAGKHTFVVDLDRKSSIILLE